MSSFEQRDVHHRRFPKPDDWRHEKRLWPGLAEHAFSLGHYFSWRMMLRGKSVGLRYDLTVEDTRVAQ